MSAANAVRDHLNTWFFGTKEGEWVSMGIVTETKAYDIPEQLVYSMPVTCKNFEWELVPNLKIDEFSRSKMDVTLQELQ